MKDKIKELNEMWDMINNYEVLEATNEYFYALHPHSRRYDYYQHNAYTVFLRRTEHSKIIKIMFRTDNFELIKTTYDDDTILTGNGIDPFAVLMVKQGINDQIKEANKNLWEVEQ